MIKKPLMDVTELLPECWSMIVYQLWINGLFNDVKSCSLVSTTVNQMCEQEWMNLRKVRKILWRWRSIVVTKKIQNAPKDDDEFLFSTLVDKQLNQFLIHRFKQQAGIVMHLLMEKLEKSITPISNYFVWTLALVALFDQLMSKFLCDNDSEMIDQMFIDSHEFQSLNQMIQDIQLKHRWWIPLLNF